MSSNVALQKPNENTIRFYSVIDRLILKKKVLEHFLRNLAEKQALIKFYYLDSSEGKPFQEEFISQPLYVGTYLLHSEKEHRVEETPFHELKPERKRYLLPFLLDYVEVIDKDDGKKKLSTASPNIVNYFVRACNLHAYPEKKLMEDPAGAQMFSYNYLQCTTFIPVQLIQFRSSDDEFPFSTKVLTAVQYWFNLMNLVGDHKILLQSEVLASSKLIKFPFYLIMYMLNVSLIYKKISPHVTLPYFIHTAQESAETLALHGGGSGIPPLPPGITTYTSSIKSVTTMYVATESPEFLLQDFAAIPTRIAENPALREHWERTEQKTMDQLLTIIWTIGYTMYIYSLLGIYEKAFENEATGIPWVGRNIRAFKMQQTGLGYWTYKLSALPNDIPAIVKHIPNMGFFWTISDFSTFQKKIGKTPEELQDELAFQGQGILYYIVLSLLQQVNTWFRRKRKQTLLPNEVPTLLPTTTIESIELELSDFSVYDRLDNEEILHRLEDLKVTLDNYPAYREPETYRKFLNHIIFIAWDNRPSNLSSLQKKEKIGSRFKHRKQLDFLFKIMKRIVNCNLNLIYKDVVAVEVEDNNVDPRIWLI